MTTSSNHKPTENYVDNYAEDSDYAKHVEARPSFVKKPSIAEVEEPKSYPNTEDKDSNEYEDGSIEKEVNKTKKFNLDFEAIAGFQTLADVQQATAAILTRLQALTAANDVATNKNERNDKMFEILNRVLKGNEISFLEMQRTMIEVVDKIEDRLIASDARLQASEELITKIDEKLTLLTDECATLRALINNQ